MFTATKEDQRKANARRQREFIERRKQAIALIESKAHGADVLEDSIKLAANNGDDLAKAIMAAVSLPTVDNLAAWFQERAKVKSRRRPASANSRKAPPTIAVVGGA